MTLLGPRISVQQPPTRSRVYQETAALMVLVFAVTGLLFYVEGTYSGPSSGPEYDAYLAAPIVVILGSMFAIIYWLRRIRSRKRPS